VHIVPHAAGGRQTTYLCASCNSRSAKQDRWLGDYLLMRKSGRDVLDGKNVRKMQIGDIPVGGTLKRTAEGIEVHIWEDRTSPEALAALEEGTRAKAIRSITFSAPILRNQHFIPIGVLGSGYLYFFKLFGYGWAFQSHLDIVREQIMNPGSPILSVRHRARVSRGPHDIQVGIAEFPSELALFAMLGDDMVFYPGATTAKGFYDRLPASYRTMPPKLHSFLGNPDVDSLNLGLIMGARALIYPNQVPGGIGELSMLYAETPAHELRLLRRITDVQRRQHEANPTAFQRVTISLPDS